MIINRKKDENAPFCKQYKTWPSILWSLCQAFEQINMHRLNHIIHTLIILHNKENNIQIWALNRPTIAVIIEFH